MNNQDDCPSKSNNCAVAGFVDSGEVERLSKEAQINKRVRAIARWQTETLPKALADNAARLHSPNKQALREAGAAIDAHRAGEGKDAYNLKRRKVYADEKGGPSREYVRGLTEEEKKARRLEKDRERKKAKRLAMTQADRDREAEKKRDQRELKVIADEASRKTF